MRKTATITIEDDEFGKIIVLRGDETREDKGIVIDLEEWPDFRSHVDDQVQKGMKMEEEKEKARTT